MVIQGQKTFMYLINMIARQLYAEINETENAVSKVYFNNLFITVK